MDILESNKKKKDAATKNSEKTISQEIINKKTPKYSRERKNMCKASWRSHLRINS